MRVAGAPARSASPPRVAAVVLASRRAEDLDEVIAALLAQTRAPDAIVLVDADATPEVQVVLGRRAAQHAHVEVLRLGYNAGSAGGFAAGLNHVADEDFDYAFACDDDAVPAPEALERVLAAAQRADRVGAVGAVSCTPEGELAWQLWPVGARAPVGTLSELRAVAGGAEVLAVSELAWHALLVPTQVVRTLGPPDARLFMWYEDVEYGLRLRGAGLRVYVVPQTTVTHPAPPPTVGLSLGRVHVGVPLTDPWKCYLMVRNSLVVRHRHCGLRFWWADLPLTLLRAGIVAVALPGPRVQIVRRIVLRAIADAVRGRMGPPPPAVLAVRAG